MESPHLPEQTIDSKELLTEEEFNGLLSGVGNHEAKLLTTALIGAHPETWFTMSRLHSEIVRAQGEKPAWVSANGVPFGYCNLSLEPIGAVVSGSVKSLRGPRPAYKISDFGKDWGLAFAGGLLDWSLKYPDISLQELFGSTVTRFKSRAPETRFHIYEEILTSPETNISFADIAKSLQKFGFNWATTEENLRRLTDMGILHSSSSLKTFNPIFKIINPRYERPTGGIPFNRLKKASQIVYMALEGLVERGVNKANLEDILAEGYTMYPDIDLLEFRRLLVMGASAGATNLPGLVLTDRNGAPVSRTEVKINHIYKQAITELVDSLESLRQRNNLPFFCERARLIISNPEKCNLIMEKARRFSSGYAAQAEGSGLLAARMINIFTELGALSLEELRNELASRGRRLTRAGVQAALKPLITEGSVSHDVVKPDPSKKNRIKKYYVRQPQQ